MRVVLDTDVIVAALRSPAGASAALLRAVRAGKLEIVINVPLAMEYEAVCRQGRHILHGVRSCATLQANLFSMRPLTDG